MAQQKVCYSQSASAKLPLIDNDVQRMLGRKNPGQWLPHNYSSQWHRHVGSIMLKPVSECSHCSRWGQK
jgi:hypothetical protein